MMYGYSKQDNNFSRQWYKKICAIDHIGSKCILCGNTNIFQLEFHHRDCEDKEKSLSVFIRCDNRMKRIINEVDKCDLLCANCHQDLHYNQGRQEYETQCHKRKNDLLNRINKFECEICGYNKNIACLVFHHKNKNKKLFGISLVLAGKNEFTMKDIIKETIKCELLCHNCHRLKHVDIDRFNKLKPYIDHKIITYKEYKPINRDLVLVLLNKGLNQREVAKEIGCCFEAINIIVKEMRKKGILCQSNYLP